MKIPTRRFGLPKLKATELPGLPSNKAKVRKLGWSLNTKPAVEWSASRRGPHPQQKWLSLPFYQKAIFTREMGWSAAKRCYWKSGSNFIFGSLKLWHGFSSVLRALLWHSWYPSLPPPLPEAFENHISLKGLRNDSVWRKRERLNNFLMIRRNPYVCAGCFNIGQDPYTGLSEKQDGLKNTTQG